MRVEKDFEEFIELLNSHNVKYLIVGAYALTFYTEPRNTGDIDFFVEPSAENAKKLIMVLSQFGFDSLEIKESDFTNQDMIIQLGYAPNRIDLITSLSGLSFEECYESKIEMQFGNNKVFIISLEKLIKNKRASGRAKDLADLEMIKKYFPEFE